MDVGKIMLETLKQKQKKRWKLYGSYSPSHEVFLRSWFLTTLKDNFEICFKRIEDQKCASAQFMSAGWVDAVSEKIIFLLKILEETPTGDRFIFSDVDIQWFRPVSSILDSIISSNEEIDIFFQEDGFGEFCTGFFVCRSNDTTKSFWSEVLHHMNSNKVGDQKAVKTLIEKNVFPELKVKLLPKQFWGPGQQQTNLDFWIPGKPLYPPVDLFFHHANWTSGIPNKISQLTYIQSKIYGTK